MLSKYKILSLVMIGAIALPIGLYVISILQNDYAKSGENIYFKRNYKEIKLNIEFAKEIDFLVTKVKVYKNKIFVDDFYSRQIVEIDDHGNVLKRFGKKGQGPGEFMRIDAWDIDEDGIYAVDSEMLRITELDFNGNLKTNISLNRLFLAANKLVQNKYLLFCLEKYESDFYIFDCKENSYSKLASEFFRNKDGLAVVGFLTKNADNGTLFFAGYHHGYIMAIDKQGHLLYQTYTIDKTPLPKVIKQSGGIQFIDPTATETINSCFSEADKLYLISVIKAQNEREINNLPIDVYDVSNGNYLYSFYIPLYSDEPPGAIAIDTKNRRIIAHQGESIIFYTLANE